MVLFGAGMTKPHAFAKAPLPAEGLKPSKSCSFTLREGKDSSAKKALLLLLVLESSGCSTPPYSPSHVPQGQVGTFSPPGCLLRSLLPFGKVGTWILKAPPRPELRRGH